MKATTEQKKLTREIEAATQRLRTATTTEDQVDAVNDINAAAYKLHKIFNPLN